MKSRRMESEGLLWKREVGVRAESPVKGSAVWGGEEMPKGRSRQIMAAWGKLKQSQERRQAGREQTKPRDFTVYLGRGWEEERG